VLFGVIGHFLETISIGYFNVSNLKSTIWRQICHPFV
jgi:hypothetical protein